MYTYLVLGLLLISMGMMSLMARKLHYRNVWGGFVFAPFAILGGLLAIVAAVSIARKIRRPSRGSHK